VDRKIEADPGSMAPWQDGVPWGVAHCCLRVVTLAVQEPQGPWWASSVREGRSAAMLAGRPAGGVTASGAPDSTPSRCLSLSL